MPRSIAVNGYLVTTIKKKEPYCLLLTLLFIILLGPYQQWGGVLFVHAC